MDMVKLGQYEMGHTVLIAHKGKDPVLLMFTTMPFGMNALEQYAWFILVAVWKLCKNHESMVCTLFLI